MDFDDPHTLLLFVELFGTLPRAGPGSSADTLRALDLVPTEDIGTVLDLGCGPGAQTLTLAHALPDATILALDLLPSMVDETVRRIARAGFGNRVRAEVGDMQAPDVPVSSQDLIWCEGAIYNVGVAAALRRWRPVLSDGGAIAFTEPVWLTDSPPAEVAEWWRSEYPGLTDVSGVEAEISAAGYRCEGSFVLPPGAWWDEYYGPMSDRIPAFVAEHPDDPVATEIADEAKREIEIFHRFSECYSYEFFVVRPR